MKPNPKLAEHLNTTANTLLGLLEESIEPTPTQRAKIGSIGNKIVEDVTDRKVDEPHRIVETLGSEVVSIQECYKGKCVGFNRENLAEFKKLLDNIYKDTAVKNQISKNFVSLNAFDWFMISYKNGGHFQDFSAYMWDKMEKSIDVHYLHFPIHNLEIFTPFAIGKVKIHYLTDEDINAMYSKFVAKFPDVQHNPIDKIRKDYQGQVLAHIGIRAEKDKAKEIALEYCSLAVDVLKMFSEATEHPSLHVSFDIDRRLREIEMAEIFYQRASDDSNFFIDYERIAGMHIIGPAEWERMGKFGMHFFHEFLENLKQDRSELEGLIINSIKKFADIVSTRSLTQRVVSIFALLESLLLRNDNAPIVDSISKYLPNLVLQKANQRKELAQLLKDMYKVRSGMIHHAKEMEIDLNDMRRLQMSVVTLFITLIQKSKTHKTKTNILDEIDDTLLGAYKLG